MAPILSVDLSLHSLKPRQQPFFSEAQETDRSHFDMNRLQDMLSRFGHFSFGCLVRLKLCTYSGVDHVSCPEGREMNAEGL